MLVQTIKRYRRFGMRLSNPASKLILALFLILAGTTAEADTLYKWTDSDGVPRFSNQPPPPEVDSYEVIETGPSPEMEQERSSYRIMMDRVQEENRQRELLERQMAQMREKEEKSRAEAEHEQRIQAQRQQLQQKIDEINRRALGPHFTEGMRRAQIEEIQKKIDELK
jgi:hypothetical protein